VKREKPNPRDAISFIISDASAPSKVPRDDFPREEPSSEMQHLPSKRSKLDLAT